MPRIGTSSAARAVAKVNEAVSARAVVKAGLWFAAIFAVVAGLYTQNVTIILGACGAAAACFVEVILAKTFILWTRLGEGSARCEYHDERYKADSKLSARQILVVAGLPVLVLFGSSFIFDASLGTTTYVCGNRTSGTDGWILAIPFAQHVTLISDRQNVDVEVVATTADGQKVRGRILTDMELVNNKPAIMRIAHEFRDPGTAIQNRLQQALAEQFRSEIAKRQLADLRPTLVLEYQTGTAANANLMAALDIRWNGVLRIDDLHAYFGAE